MDFSTLFNYRLSFCSLSMFHRITLLFALHVHKKWVLLLANFIWLRLSNEYPFLGWWIFTKQRMPKEVTEWLSQRKKNYFFLGILTLIGFVDGVTFYNLYFGCPLASIAWPIGNLPIALLQLALCFSIKNVDDKIKDG